MKGYYQELYNINNNNLSLQEKIHIIKRISTSHKKDELFTIFYFHNLYGLSRDEILEVFQALSYRNKMLIIEEIPDEIYKKILISKMSHLEYYKLLYERKLNYELLNYVISLLSEQECLYISRMMLTLKFDIKLLLIQRQSESAKIKYLLNKQNWSLNTERIRKGLLKSLASDEEKLACFTYPNKYDLHLNRWEILNVILSLSDNERYNFFKNDEYYGIHLNTSERERLALTLSDEIKISFLNNLTIIKDYFEGYPEKLIGSLSEKACHQVLLTRIKYKLLEDRNLLINLINNMSLTDRISVLNDDNEYQLKLTTEEKVHVIISLPDENKIKLIKEKSFNFSEQNFKQILCTVNPTKLLNMLVFTDNYINDTDFVKYLIKNLEPKIIECILQAHNHQLKLLREKYLLEFVKKLSSREKTNILFNRSKYDLKLTEQDKLKLLGSISSEQKIKSHDNALACFENPEIVVNYYSSSAKRFNSLNPCFQKQIANYYFEKYHLIASEELLLAILKYSDQTKEILNNYQIFNNIFNQLGIKLTDFIQYGINTDQCHWDQIMLEIIKKANIYEFINVYKYFNTYYYHKSESPKDTIKNFLEILNFYQQNYLLCLSIVNNNSL